MTRFQQKIDGIRAAIHKICPKIQKKLERFKDEARSCICRWQNELEFEVDHMFDTRRTVNLAEGTCMCGRCQINDIPCAHACAAIYMHKERPEQHLDGYYTITFLLGITNIHYNKLRQCMAVHSINQTPTKAINKIDKDTNI
jgi:hypothetical protein